MMYEAESKELIRRTVDHIQPDTWCQLFEAVDAQGAQVELCAPAAARRCTLGWLAFRNFQAPDLPASVWSFAAKLLEQKAGIKSLAEWNDRPERTAADVRELLRSVL